MKVWFRNKQEIKDPLVAAKEALILAAAKSKRQAFSSKLQLLENDFVEKVTGETSRVFRKHAANSGRSSGAAIQESWSNAISATEDFVKSAIQTSFNCDVTNDSALNNWLTLVFDQRLSSFARNQLAGQFPLSDPQGERIYQRLVAELDPRKARIPHIIGSARLDFESGRDTYLKRIVRQFENHKFSAWVIISFIVLMSGLGLVKAYEDWLN